MPSTHISLMKTAMFDFTVYNDRPKFQFIEVNQVHGNDVFNLRPKDETQDIDADGIVLYAKDWKSTPIPSLAIKTADCLPIVLIGTEGMAILHAGWKGVNQDIWANKCIAPISPFMAYIGPHICENHYEIQKDFLNHFPKTKSIIKRDDKMFFSLLLESKYRLWQTFGQEFVIFDSGICTFEAENLNSYRRDKNQKRNYNILKNIKLNHQG